MAQEPDRAARFIGPLGCTLGRVQSFHDAAASSTERGRQFPEVFLGTGLAVSIALTAMRLSQREVIHRHYIERVWAPRLVKGRLELVRLRWPLRQGLIAQRMGLDPQEYYLRRDTAKACIRVALYGPEKPVALSPRTGVFCAQSG